MAPPTMIHNMALMIFANPSAFFGFISEALAIKCGIWWCVCIGVQLCVILVIEKMVLYYGMISTSVH